MKKITVGAVLLFFGISLFTQACFSRQHPAKRAHEPGKTTKVHLNQVLIIPNVEADPTKYILRIKYDARFLKQVNEQGHPNASAFYAIKRGKTKVTWYQVVRNDKKKDISVYQVKIK